MNEKLMGYEYFTNRIMVVSSNFMLFPGFSPTGTLPRKKNKRLGNIEYFCSAAKKNSLGNNGGAENSGISSESASSGLGTRG